MPRNYNTKIPMVKCQYSKKRGSEGLVEDAHTESNLSVRNVYNPAGNVTNWNPNPPVKSMYKTVGIPLDFSLHPSEFQ